MAWSYEHKGTVATGRPRRCCKWVFSAWTDIK